MQLEPHILRCIEIVTFSCSPNGLKPENSHTDATTIARIADIAHKEKAKFVKFVYIIHLFHKKNW